MVLSIVPMCSGEPNNRMLFVASIGAAGLLACWWDAYAGAIAHALGRYSQRFGKLMLVCHLLVSPFLVPMNAVVMVFYNSLYRFDDVGEEAVGRDAVFSPRRITSLCA